MKTFLTQFYQMIILMRMVVKGHRFLCQPGERNMDRTIRFNNPCSKYRPFSWSPTSLWQEGTKEGIMGLVAVLKESRNNSKFRSMTMAM